MGSAQSHWCDWLLSMDERLQLQIDGRPTSVSFFDDSVVMRNIKSLDVTGLSADSRHIRSGEAFLALPGLSNHGLDYLSQVEGSAAVVIADADDQRAQSVQTDLPLIFIRGLIDNLGLIVSAWYANPTQSIPVCGITGTDGKTSTAWFVAGLLRALGRKVGYIGTIGWGIDESLEPNPLTTPPVPELQRMLASLKEDGAEFIVMEVSSHALVQGRVDGVWFNVAALTNLGRDHLDYHGTLENYEAAKQKLFEWPGLSAAILNLDDDFGLTIGGSSSVSAARLWGYTQHKGSQILPPRLSDDDLLCATDVVTDHSGIAFTLDAVSTSWDLKVDLLGKFNVSNLLAALGVVRAFGISLEQAVSALDRIVSVPGRMELFSQKGKPVVVVDFAHTPQALQSALETAKDHCEGKLWVVFGCGGDRDPGKRPQMGVVAFNIADCVVVTDDNPRSEQSAKIIGDIVDGIASASTSVSVNDLRDTSSAQLSDTVWAIANRRDAIVHACQHAGADDWVLIAGKGHEDYQIVGSDRHYFSDRDMAREMVFAEALS